MCHVQKRFNNSRYSFAYLKEIKICKFVHINSLKAMPHVATMPKTFLHRTMTYSKLHTQLQPCGRLWCLPGEDNEIYRISPQGSPRGRWHNFDYLHQEGATTCHKVVIVSEALNKSQFSVKKFWTLWQRVALLSGSLCVQICNFLSLSNEPMNIWSCS